MKHSEQIKFDYDSGLEILFNILIFVGIVIFLFGMPGKNGNTLPFPLYPGLIIMGINISFIFSILRLFTNDYIVLDPVDNYVIMHYNFLNMKSSSKYCPLKSIRAVKFAESQSFIKIKNNVEFTVLLVFSDGKIRKSKRSSTVNIKQGCKFDASFGELRNWAIHIASIVGCKVSYSPKVPRHEQLQPKFNEEDEFGNN